MTNENQKSAAGSTTMAKVGWFISAIPILMLGVLPIFYLTAKQDAVAAAMAKYNYPSKYAVGIFIAEIICAWIYAIPKTSVLGAILVTGYLGGAVATHVRADELPYITGPLFFATLAWLGLFLREPRLRALVPLRR